MKAIVVMQNGAPEQLELREWPTPQPKAGQVLIKTALCSVNFADVLSRRGGYEAGAAPPFVPGLDVVGTVEALGEGVDDLYVGQRVVAFAQGGSYAEYCLAAASLAYPVPNDLSNEAVSGLTVLVTAYNLLHWVGRLQAGDRVVVHAAAGGVGSTLLQMAKAMGAAQVLATLSHPTKAPVAQKLGADAVFTYENWVQQVLQHTQGAGADLILDSLSGEVAEQGLQALAPFGRLVIYGHARQQTALLPSQPLHRQNKAVLGYSSGHYRRERPQALRPSVLAVMNWLQQGKVLLEIGARFPLARAAEAHRWVESRQSVGKVLLYP